jgi:hypothetical protein
MSYEKRVKYIEKKLDQKEPFVDPKDKIQVIKAPMSELENEREKRKMEMIQRYGEEALSQIIFVGVIQFGITEMEKENQL